ncbi:hypothetical protein GCM10009601_50170 [Streptomyces thermospinosisporus]|uniref:Uncharacterized protein n=1 Tax=Streptomyces thermospinosisporus TaxID=161482 RepID=A0ABN1Z4E8_9ACTN
MSARCGEWGYPLWGSVQGVAEQAGLCGHSPGPFVRIGRTTSAAGAHLRETGAGLRKQPPRHKERRRGG